MVDENKPIESIDDLAYTAEMDEAAIGEMFAAAATGTTEPVTPVADPQDDQQQNDGQQADANAGLPSWLQQVPEDDRDTMLTSWLGSLPADKLASLAPINGLLTQAQIDAAEAGRNEVQDAFTRQASEQQVINAALGLTRDLEPYIPDDAGINVAERLNQFGGVYGLAYARKQLGDGMATAFQTVNLSVPEEVMQMADQNGKKGGPALAAATYAVWGMQTAYAAGEAAGISKSATNSKADTAAMKAQIREEYLAELVDQGRIKSAVPPSLGSGELLGGGGAGSHEIGENAGLDELWGAAAANLNQMRAAGKR